MFTYVGKLKFCANRIHHILSGEDTSDEVVELLTLERADGTRLTLCLTCFYQYKRIIYRLGIQVVDNFVEPRSLLPTTFPTLKSCDDCLHHFLSFENLESNMSPRFAVLKGGNVDGGVICLCENCAKHWRGVLQGFGATWLQTPR